MWTSSASNTKVMQINWELWTSTSGFSIQWRFFLNIPIWYAIRLQHTLFAYRSKILLASSRLMSTPMPCRQCWISAASIWPVIIHQSHTVRIDNIVQLIIISSVFIDVYRPSLFLSSLLNMSLSCFSWARRYCVNSSKSRTPSWLVSPVWTSWKTETTNF